MSWKNDIITFYYPPKMTDAVFDPVQVNKGGIIFFYSMHPYLWVHSTGADRSVTRYFFRVGTIVYMVGYSWL